MVSSRWFRFASCLAIAGSGCFAAAAVGGEALLLADGKTFPGKLWTSEAGGSERLFFQREATANAAYPQATMKLGHVAVAPGNKIHYCSGLDGYVMHLLDGRHEILSFEFDGQIRDVACTDEDHTVYFSVVPTPQGDQPLADGEIYRRDLWQGQPTEVATVKQSDVGGAWWGAFAVRDRDVYIATLEDSSRVFKLSSDGPELVGVIAGHRISGFTASDGGWLLAEGSGKIFRTSDFRTIEEAFLAVRPISDVAVAGATRE
jgi:hypothetical protein